MPLGHRTAVTLGVDDAEVADAAHSSSGRDKPEEGIHPTIRIAFTTLQSPGCFGLRIAGDAGGSVFNRGFDVLA